MQKTNKRLVSLLLAVVMTMALSASAFAAQPVSAASMSEESLSISASAAASSISGYEQKTITKSDNSMIVWVTASGTGGMGITVKGTCSSNYSIKVHVLGNDGTTPVSGKTAYTNGEVQFNNLTHYGDPGYYLVTFEGVPSGVSFLAQVWIYG